MDLDIKNYRFSLSCYNLSYSFSLGFRISKLKRRKYCTDERIKFDISMDIDKKGDF